MVSNTGAYGGHGSETLGAALGPPMTLYRCANKQADGYAYAPGPVYYGGPYAYYGGPYRHWHHRHWRHHW